jgi:psiF repeat
MKRLLVLAAASIFAFGLASSAMALTPQQEKMKTCNAEAKTKALKGAERKAFMKECLSAKKAEEPKAKATQQDKMKGCNADAKAKSLKGEERKKFMSECLKG